LKKRNLKAFGTIALLVMIYTIIYFTPLPNVKAELTSPASVEDIYDDGFTRTDTGAKDNTSTYLRIRNTTIGAVEFISWVEWNLTEIPDTATIYGAWIEFRVSNGWNDSFGIRFVEYQNVTTPPSGSKGSDIIIDIQEGEYYTSILNTNISAGSEYTYELGGSIATNITTMLASDWFALGIRPVGNDEEMRLYSEDGGFDTTLWVDTDQGTYRVTLSGTFFENGTQTTPVLVTAVENDGTETQLNVSGTRYLGFSSQPEQIYWAMSGGGTRHFFTPLATENITVYVPEATYSSYEMPFIDYTRKFDGDNTYFELRRAVNGTEDIIERDKVYDTFNPVGVYAVIGGNYRLITRWSDDSTYDHGYWIAGVDPTRTLVHHRLAFSDRAQFTYKYLSIEATRQNATHIRVNYLDETPALYGTDWCNVTVAYRNGTIVQTFNSTAETFTWNWYGADNETDYWVNAVIDHGYYTLNLDYWEMLDYSRSYNLFPSFPSEWTFSGMVASNLFALFGVLGVFAVFSRESADIALIASFSIASILRMWNAVNWSWELIGLGMALSIAYAVYRGRVRP
jgi:hypothetical protein